MNKITYTLGQRLPGTPQEYWTLRIKRAGREDEVHTGGRAYVVSRIPAGAVRVGNGAPETREIALEIRPVPPSEYGSLESRESAWAHAVLTGGE